MKKLPVPIGVFDQHIAVLGKTRSGKSSVMRLLVEHLLDTREPVCILDPKGDWWGLRLSADGRQQGYPIIFFGDPHLAKHVDIAITEHVGADVAELVATGNRPSLIDFGGWTVGARTRFYIDFAETLFRRTVGDRWLVVDEIHNFGPKGSLKGTERSRMPESLHWTNRLASEGLGKGVHLVFASQRPQKVHNDILTSAETLVAMRVLHPSDREAVSDWIAAAGDQSGKDVLASLADLARGEGWAWSPEIRFGPERIAFPLFSTYDSFKAQRTDRTKLKGWGDVDLGEINVKLAQVQEAKRANDPAELRKQIAELKRQVAQREKQPIPKAAPERQLKVIEKPVLKDGQLARAEKLVENLQRAARTLAETAAVLGGDTLARVGQITGEVADAIRTTTIDARVVEQADTDRAWARPVVPPTKRLRHLGQAAAPPGSPGYTGNGIPDDRLLPVEQRILDALAELAALGNPAPPKELVAVFAGYTNLRSKGFQNAIGALRGKDLLTYPQPGRMGLSDAGARVARQPPAPMTTVDVVARVESLLGPKAGQVLEPLARVYPRALDRTDVAARAGYENTRSKGFANLIGRLRTLGFVDYPSTGQVAASPLLMLEAR